MEKWTREEKEEVNGRLGNKGKFREMSQVARCVVCHFHFSIWCVKKIHKYTAQSTRFLKFSVRVFLLVVLSFYRSTTRKNELFCALLRPSLPLFKLRAADSLFGELRVCAGHCTADILTSSCHVPHVSGENNDCYWKVIFHSRTLRNNGERRQQQQQQCL